MTTIPTVGEIDADRILQANVDRALAMIREGQDCRGVLAAAVVACEPLLDAS